MKRLVVESWLFLFRIECVMRRDRFQELHQMVQEAPVRPAASILTPYETLCLAMDYACVLYFKRVLCLQRSAATALLLRHHGWRAGMVVGTQMLPFRSHAWCEIDGAVVNDKPYVHEIYQVLQRC
jgi:hypothetical protein